MSYTDEETYTGCEACGVSGLTKWTEGVGFYCQDCLDQEEDRQESERKKEMAKKLPSKTIWIDTETTGLSPVKNGIREIACLIEIDNKIVDEVLLYINPSSYVKSIEYDDYALQISDKTIEEIHKYPSSTDQFKQFIKTLDLYIDADNKYDKFQVAGFNTAFDTDFIKAWFKDSTDVKYSAYFSYAEIDVLAFARMLSYNDCFTTDSHRLIDLCSLFEIPLIPHNALDDIKATYELNNILNVKYLLKEEVN